MDYPSFKKSVGLDTNSDIFNERREDEILSAMDEFTDRIWYDRHQLLKHRVENKSTKVDEKIWKGALKAAKQVEKNMELKV